MFPPWVPFFGRAEADARRASGGKAATRKVASRLFGRSCECFAEEQGRIAAAWRAARGNQPLRDPVRTRVAYRLEKPRSWREVAFHLGGLNVVPGVAHRRATVPPRDVACLRQPVRHDREFVEDQRLYACQAHPLDDREPD